MRSTHQYVDRSTGQVVTEKLFGDRIVRFLYSSAREQAPDLFRMVTGPHCTSLLGLLNFDQPLCSRLLGNQRFLRSNGVDLSECVRDPATFKTAREIFERQIRYWETRPLPEGEEVIVSPADSRVILGSFSETSGIFLKDKFFEYEELLGERRDYRQRYRDGDFAVFRLTPDKYHYNHVPVSGRVVDYYEISGDYHSCHPGAIIEMMTPYSKNKPVVTVIDTEVPEGSRVGQVVMIEIVALMIGEIVQCYSDHQYEDPQPIEPGMFLKRGQVKSLYRPGSSTDVLIFEAGRVAFDEDLVSNRLRPDVHTHFSSAFGQPVVETELAVRSSIGVRRESS